MTSPRNAGVAFGSSGNQALQIGKFGSTSPFKNIVKGAGGNQATSPNDRGGPNLSGLVSVKAYEKLYTSEVPSVTCSLLPT